MRGTLFTACRYPKTHHRALLWWKSDPRRAELKCQVKQSQHMYKEKTFMINCKSLTLSTAWWWAGSLQWVYQGFVTETAGSCWNRGWWEQWQWLHSSKTMTEKTQKPSIEHRKIEKLGDNCQTLLQQGMVLALDIWLTVGMRILMSAASNIKVPVHYLWPQKVQQQTSKSYMQSFRGRVKWQAFVTITNSIQIVWTALKLLLTVCKHL